MLTAHWPNSTRSGRISRERRVPNSKSKPSEHSWQEAALSDSPGGGCLPRTWPMIRGKIDVCLRCDCMKIPLVRAFSFGGTLHGQNLSSYFDKNRHWRSLNAVNPE